MSNFFNADNPIFTFLGKVCDVIVLSVIFIILCIPVITIGPASTALYYTTVKVIRRERGYLFREFFKSFKLNFKSSCIFGIIITICYVLIIVDILSTWTMGGISVSAKSILLGVYIAIVTLLTCFTIYVFPVLSRFEIKKKQMFKVVFFMSMKHLPFTILMLIIQAAALVAVYVMPISIFIIPATSVFLISLLMERIFKKYMNQQEDAENDSNKDAWYLE